MSLEGTGARYTPLSGPVYLAWNMPEGSRLTLPKDARRPRLFPPLPFDLVLVICSPAQPPRRARFVPDALSTGGYSEALEGYEWRGLRTAYHLHNPHFCRS